VKITIIYRMCRYGLLSFNSVWWALIIYDAGWDCSSLLKVISK